MSPLLKVSSQFYKFTSLPAVCINQWLITMDCWSIFFFLQKKMKYACTKDQSFASVGKHGVLREFSFFDKVRMTLLLCSILAPLAVLLLHCNYWTDIISSWTLSPRFVACLKARKYMRTSCAALPCSTRKWCQEQSCFSSSLHSWGEWIETCLKWITVLTVCETDRRVSV